MPPRYPGKLNIIDMTTFQRLGYNSHIRYTGLPVWHGLPNPIVFCTNERICSLSSVIKKLKLHVLPKVQTTIGFVNPCYFKRLRDVSLFRLFFVKYLCQLYFSGSLNQYFIFLKAVCVRPGMMHFLLQWQRYPQSRGCLPLVDLVLSAIPLCPCTRL